MMIRYDITHTWEILKVNAAAFERAVLAAYGATDRVENRYYNGDRLLGRWPANGVARIDEQIGRVTMVLPALEGC